jgi:NADPH:quinone reductase-like Zn-dependent oxidoreductase
MRAITVRDRDAGVGGLTLTDMPYPHAAENDVIVRVHAAGFTPESSTGRERGPIARAATGHPASPGTSCPEPWSSSATEPPASPWASGCSD